jgi:hypothetical protein
MRISKPLHHTYFHLEQPTPCCRRFATAPAFAPLPPRAVTTRHRTVAAPSSSPLPPHAVATSASFSSSRSRSTPSLLSHIPGFYSALPRLGLKRIPVISYRPRARLCTLPVGIQRVQHPTIYVSCASHDGRCVPHNAAAAAVSAPSRDGPIMSNATCKAFPLLSRPDPRQPKRAYEEIPQLTSSASARSRRPSPPTYVRIH